MEQMVQPENLLPNARVESPPEEKLREAAALAELAGAMAQGKADKARQALKDAGSEEERARAQAELKSALSRVVQSAWRSRKSKQAFHAKRASKDVEARELAWRVERGAAAKAAEEEATKAKMVALFAGEGVKGNEGR
jgi:hypothetical protein